MPLVIICGRPCTGKTTFAGKLVEHIRSRGHTAVLVNEETLKLSKKDGYRNSHNEKVLRGALKGEVDHSLNTSTYVVVDSLNYIKGYRYELYCCARSMRTPHCVVWVASDESLSDQRNEQRLLAGLDGYEPSILSDLRKRFEAPNDANRWDHPLFKVASSQSGDCASKPATGHSEPAIASPAPQAPVLTKSSWKPKKAVSAPAPAVEAPPIVAAEQSSDSVRDIVWFSGSAVEGKDDLSTFSKAEDVLDGICDFLASAQAPLPNSSTVSPQHVQADLLYELDRVSQRVAHLLVTHQSEQNEGTPLQLREFDRVLTLHRHVSMAELQRLRGQWVKANAQRPPQSIEAIGASFVDFLAVHL